MVYLKNVWYIIVFFSKPNWGVPCVPFEMFGKMEIVSKTNFIDCSYSMYVS